VTASDGAGPDREAAPSTEAVVSADVYGERNAAHIAAMDPPTTLALLAEVVTLREQVARVRTVHRKSVGGDPYGDHALHAACRHCRKSWPCPTIAALDAPKETPT
jgi:hypothetical protein